LRLIALLIACLVGTTAEAAAPAAGKVIEPAGIMSLRKVGDPQISPDGRRALFTVAEPQPAGAPDRSTIWIVPMDGAAPARPFILGDGTDSAPRWSPDGRSVAFLSKRRNPLHPGADKATQQIWLLPVDGGEATVLTDAPGEVQALKWSRDGTRLGFILRDPETPEHAAATEARRDMVEIDRSYRMSRFWVYDLAGHQARGVSPASLNIDDFDWSPDGRQVAARVTDTPRINDFYYHSRILLLDGTSGAPGKVLTTHGAASSLAWSPDGRKIAYFELGTGGISTTLELYDLAAGKSMPMGESYRGLIQNVAWLPDSTALVAEGFEATRLAFYRLDIGSGAMVKMADARGFLPEFTVSADGKAIAFQAETPDHPDEIWALAGARTRALTDVNPQVATWRRGAVSEIRWTNSRDKTEIFGVLVTPPDYKPGTPTKMVVQIHGGPEWAWWSGWLGSWHEWAQLLASHGYVVFLPNPRGSDGQGTAFARLVGNDWGGADFQDILDGVDMLVRQKIADPARLGIGGWSYGGFMSAWAITHSDRFKAAVMGAAPTDLTMMGLTSDCPDFLPGYFGEVPDHRADYDAHSPLRFVEKVRTPVLILHGEADPRVPISQDEAFYNSLRRLDRPVEMVRYPREPHWFDEMAHQRDILERVLGWFDEKLAP